ncbi:MAG TPA: GAF domain-containing protein [Gemmatimonadaceae bacterium]|nr:GAF domain-containing protein [Gemmatimonadaceae bacterium]
MAESTLDLAGVAKPEAYAQLRVQIDAVLEGIDDDVAAMATISSAVHYAMRHLWTGFYRVVPPGRLLRVGPYQGTLGCLEIEFGRGVCGTAAASGQTVIVDDVAEFPDHITCDARARSEIVVPVFDSSGALLAVLDVDSDRLRSFDEADREGLEAIVAWFSRRVK